MAATFHFDEAPPMWWVSTSTHEEPNASEVSMNDTLHLGRHAVHLGDIVDYHISEERNRDIEGLLVAGAGFIAIASVFLIGVMSFGWGENFLLAFAFLAFFGAASFFEILRIRPVGHFVVTVWTANGQQVPFACTDEKEIAELTEFLEGLLE